MTTQQPKWKHIASIGDVDPISYGGGFVYSDETGVYGLELAWFEPATDEVWQRHLDADTEDTTPVDVYRVLIEAKPESEWWYPKLQEIASYTGRSLEELHADCRSKIPVHQATLYGDLIHYFGVEEFDQSPVTMTQGEAYKRYASELKAAGADHGRTS